MARVNNIKWQRGVPRDDRSCEQYWIVALLQLLQPSSRQRWPWRPLYDGISTSWLHRAHKSHSHRGAPLTNRPRRLCPYHISVSRSFHRLLSDWQLSDFFIVRFDNIHRTDNYVSCAYYQNFQWRNHTGVSGNVRWPRRILTLVSQVKYAPRALLELEKRWNKQTDRRTDGCQTVTLRLRPDEANVINWPWSVEFMPTCKTAVRQNSSCSRIASILSSFLPRTHFFYKTSLKLKILPYCWKTGFHWRCVVLILFFSILKVYFLFLSNLWCLSAYFYLIS